MSEKPNMKRLDELLIILVDEKLSEAQKRELDEILQSDPAAVEYYESYIDTHVALDWHFGANSLDLPSGLEPIIDEVPSTEPVKFPIGAIIALAALIIIGLYVSALGSSVSYKVSNEVSAVWQGENNYEVGASLKSSKLLLASGYSELQTDEGVKIILEGPAELEIISDKKIVLKKGKLVATVPAKSSGFEIQTPQVDILDSKTEFGLTVGENGQTEIHALEGEVTTSEAGKKGVVEASQARVIMAQKSVLVKADAGRFMRVLPEKEKVSPSYINWSFNEGQGHEVAQKGKNLPDRNFNAYFRSTYENGPKPQWVEGKFGKALNFDAQGGYLETDFPGIGGSHARTVSFWVKIPKDAVKENAISMIAWGSYAGKGKTWQVSWNWQEKDGVVGALRAGIYHGQIVGSQDLRDGEWHHVTVVMFGGKKANVSTHLLLYVDGQLEQASRKSILNVKTDIKSNKSIKVLMGRNAQAHVRNNEKHKVFNGALDEVYIFNCALDENQIRSLMDYNKSGFE